MDFKSCFDSKNNKNWLKKLVENLKFYMDTNTLIITFGILLTIIGLLNFVLLFKFRRENTAVDADMAQAFKVLMSYMEKQFELNFNTHEQIQKWHENTLETIIKEVSQTNQNTVIAGRYLTRMAESMGLQTRSNLEDV